MLQDLRVMAHRHLLESIIRRFRKETCFQCIKVQMATFYVKVQPAMSCNKKHDRMVGAVLCGK